MTDPNGPTFGRDGKHWYMTSEQWAKYPGLDKDLQSVKEINQGLTKREYFAAMAMQGIIFWDATVNERHETGKIESLAKQSIAMADALIAELSKEVLTSPPSCAKSLPEVQK